MDNQNMASLHPHDTFLSGLLRFLTELIAWISGAWAATLVSGWLVLPVLLVLIGLPAVFSTPNDKKHVVIATAGPLRVILEFILYAVALIAPWYVWSISLCLISTILVIVCIYTNLPRIVWLLKGAK